MLGTRPEAIKLAPVIAELERRDDCECVVCVTGQHRRMLDEVLDLFEIPVMHDLDVMTDRQSPADVVARIMEAMPEVLSATDPDWVVVQGDTTTTMASALAAFYARKQVAHVEAGLRTGRLDAPFPEEMNRRVVTVVAGINFAPTEGAKRNLEREGVDDERILVTGNTVVDAFQAVCARPFDSAGTSVETLDLTDKRLVLVTAHRRESFGRPLRNICSAIAQIAADHSDVLVVFPVHLNPEVHLLVHDALGGLPNVALLPPLNYVTLAQLIKRAYLILTDSGGIQEEAPSCGVPVLVLRDTTERPEGVAAGVARIVGTNPETILKEAGRLLDDESARQAMAQIDNPYGDGLAGKRIVDFLVNHQPAK